MTFNIAAFTHSGTVRSSNQDTILVNGEILNEGEWQLSNQVECNCFVADGVGGNKAGDFASRFVLEQLNKVTINGFPLQVEQLQQINRELLQITGTQDDLRGAATTLTGLVITEQIFQIFHVGDSQMWLMRNDMFFQVTKDHVLEDSAQNSPITNYFGGFENYLHLDDQINLKESFRGDFFLLCSDGLFKSLQYKVVKSILKAEKSLETKLQKILENCLRSGAEDNISVILIHQIN